MFITLASMQIQGLIQSMYSGISYLGRQLVTLVERMADIIEVGCFVSRIDDNVKKKHSASCYDRKYN